MEKEEEKIIIDGWLKLNRKEGGRKGVRWAHLPPPHNIIDVTKPLSSVYLAPPNSTPPPVANVCYSFQGKGKYVVLVSILWA